MKKLLLLSFALSSFLFASAYETTHLTGIEADQKIKGTKELRYKSFTNIPNYAAFKPGNEIAFAKFETWFANFYNGEDAAKMGMKLLGIEKDQLGFVHYRYRQTYNNNPIDLTMLIVHTKDGMVKSFNGEFYDNLSAVNHANGTTEANALNAALNYIGAKIYKWEIEEEEDHLKHEIHDHDASYNPDGELVYVASNGNFDNPLSLAYKFNIYAHEPLSRREIYISAADHSVVFENNLIHEANSTGTAVTKYSGIRSITTDSLSPTSFRLRETGRGNGINTYNLNNGSNYGSATDFTDNNNYWNNVNAQQDEVATDGHWGAEMTYDYFFINHNRNSIDGNGFALNSYVHYNTNYNNAFWDGQRMTYGDGNGTTFTPLTAIDVTGHEIAHGLTTFTAGLVYQNESGALNESFSDIFGVAVEFYAKGSITNWRIGEDMTPNGNGIRKMDTPNTFNDPDTYLGTYWYSGTQDNGGVHTNSGVQNHWFYLLTMGGSGTNDLNNAYTVTGQGVTKAGAIAFRNLTVYLTTNSQYNDARFFAIKSATDLYGACTPEVIATTNAWYACGVGPVFSTGVSADFAVSDTTACEVPFTVNFTNNSTNTQSASWTFGDGGTSTALNPSHTYTTGGTFNVYLVADGGACGRDSIQKNAIINIVLPPSPSGTNDTVLAGQSAQLIANGTGTINWYSAATGGSPIHTGDTFNTPILNVTTTYYADDQIVKPSANVGAVSNSIGAGAYFNFDQHLIFDVTKTCEIVSVLVYANSSKNRTVELRDNNGIVLQSKTINIPQGSQRINLNFKVSPGTNYQLGVTAGSQPDLYRNSNGANYPYTLSNLLSITRSSASGNNALNYYYFFYDWEVKELDCRSARTPVDGVVQFATGISNVENHLISVYPNPAKNILNVNIGDTPSNIIINDVNGKLVYNSSNQSGLVELKVNNWSNGIYFIKVVNENETFVDRLMINK